MGIVKGDMINVSNSSQIMNSANLPGNSWADRLEEFSANLKEKNAFTNHDRACFFVIKGNDGDFFEKSPKTQSHSIYYW